MKAHLYLVKDNFTQVGQGPVKKIDIEQETSVGIMDRLVREFEEILEVGQYKDSIRDNLELKILYLHPVDNGLGYIVHGPEDNKLYTPSSLSILIPALKLVDGKIIENVKT